MQLRTRLGLFAALYLLASSPLLAIEFKMQNWDDPDALPWKESEFKLPPFPQDKDLIEFYVSATATAKYYIDRTSITPGGEDKVVRYTLVVKTAGGAKNISYEGIRCDEAQLKIYATGRSDGTWVEKPRTEWVGLKRHTLNLHQGVLARNFFCPNYIPIYTVKEGLYALERGMHPDTPGSDELPGSGVR